MLEILVFTVIIKMFNAGSKARNYYAPALGGALSDAASRPSVCLSVCPTWPRRATAGGQLGGQRLGQLRHSCLQASRAVRTADPSAHGRRSAAIGGGISSRRAITSFVKQNLA